MKIRKGISIVILVAFIMTSIKNPVYAQSTASPMPWMPIPGEMVSLSFKFTPAHLKGIVIHPENALKFDFLVFKGDQPLNDQQKREEYTKLIKYFLASLAVPDENQWVNLSPYEKNRIIKDDFAKTEMGRDLLAQDYLLKQITASLIYPEKGLGQEFWEKVYSQAQAQFGTTDIPVNTFNKVWILPDNAEIYEKGNTAYVLKNHLKVMLEEDYLSLNKHSGIKEVQPNRSKDVNKIGSQIVREIVLPALEKEVNEGKNFANLRQVYSGMLLAAWFKRALKESLLGKVYANKGKVKGIDQDPRINEEIYKKYIQAYKKGVFNYIKEDVNKYTNETIPKKYFSGGTGSFRTAKDETGKDPIHIKLIATSADATLIASEIGEIEEVAVENVELGQKETSHSENNQAMISKFPDIKAKINKHKLDMFTYGDPQLIKVIALAVAKPEDKGINIHYLIDQYHSQIEDVLSNLVDLGTYFRFNSNEFSTDQLIQLAEFDNNVLYKLIQMALPRLNILYKNPNLLSKHLFALAAVVKDYPDVYTAFFQGRTLSLPNIKQILREENSAANLVQRSLIGALLTIKDSQVALNYAADLMGYIEVYNTENEKRFIKAVNSLNDIYEIKLPEDTASQLDVEQSAAPDITVDSRIQTAASQFRNSGLTSDEIRKIYTLENEVDLKQFDSLNGNKTNVMSRQIEVFLYESKKSFTFSTLDEAIPILLEFKPFLLQIAAQMDNSMTAKSFLKSLTLATVLTLSSFQADASDQTALLNRYIESVNSLVLSNNAAVNAFNLEDYSKAESMYRAFKTKVEAELKKFEGPIGKITAADNVTNEKTGKPLTGKEILESMRQKIQMADNGIKISQEAQKMHLRSQAAEKGSSLIESVTGNLKSIQSKADELFEAGKKDYTKYLEAIKQYQASATAAKNASTNQPQNVRLELTVNGKSATWQEFMQTHADSARRNALVSRYNYYVGRAKAIEKSSAKEQDALRKQLDSQIKIFLDSPEGKEASKKPTKEGQPDNTDLIKAIKHLQIELLASNIGFNLGELQIYDVAMSSTLLPDASMTVKNLLVGVGATMAVLNASLFLAENPEKNPTDQPMQEAHDVIINYSRLGNLDAADLPASMQNTVWANLVDDINEQKSRIESMLRVKPLDLNQREEALRILKEKQKAFINALTESEEFKKLSSEQRIIWTDIVNDLNDRLGQDNRPVGVYVFMQSFVTVTTNIITNTPGDLNGLSNNPSLNINTNTPSIETNTPPQASTTTIRLIEQGEQIDANGDFVKGGIDFNTANLNLQIKRDGKGVPLPISQQNFENIHIEGLIPRILEIKPALESPLLSQLQISLGHPR